MVQLPHIDQILQNNICNDEFTKGVFEEVVTRAGNDVDSIVLGSVDCTYDYMGKIKSPFDQKRTYCDF